jgi:hypothetical protein
MRPDVSKKPSQHSQEPYMINNSAKESEIVGIRALSDDEIEVITGAGIFSSIWNGIKAIGNAIVDAAKFVFNGLQSPPGQNPFPGPFNPPHHPY